VKFENSTFACSNHEETRAFLWFSSWPFLWTFAYVREHLFQRWPELLFQTPTPLLFQNFWIRGRIRLFFKFENPTPVQTPATPIDPTVIYPCFYLRNDRTDSCYCRNGKVTPHPGPVFHKFVTPVLRKNAESCRSRLRQSGSGPISDLFLQFLFVVWASCYNPLLGLTRSVFPNLFWLVPPFLTNKFLSPPLPSLAHISTQIFRIVYLGCLKRIKKRMSAKVHFTIKLNLVN